MWRKKEEKKGGGGGGGGGRTKLPLPRGDFVLSPTEEFLEG